MNIRQLVEKHFPAYLLAVVGSLIAAWVRYAIGPWLGGSIPVVMFTVPVVLSALYGGLWPGLFCTVFSALISAYLFIGPVEGPGFPSKSGLIIIVSFLVVGLILSYFGERMKRMQSRLLKQTQSLGNANQELEQANFRKDEFLAMLAHELRNPLAGISTAGELLKYICHDQRQVAQTGERITRQVRHMTKLLDDLLDVSRVTRGLVIIEKRPVDVKEALQQALEQVDTAFESKHQQLTVIVPADAVFVCGDATRLTQVLSNLLTNANRYSPAGGKIHVEIRVTDGVEISVSDNGQGISATLLPEIFDLFVQGKRSIDRIQGGLGVGLALVKKITELHDGAVSADSAGPGQGSRFTLRLPRLVPTGHDPALSIRGPKVKQALQILVVDDNEDAANSLALLLEAHEHTATVEYSARAALDRVHVEAFDAIILDIGLPEKDGRELCRQMRSIPHLVNATFLAVSGYGQQSDVDMSIDAGFAQHLTKPVKIEEIVAELARP